MRLTLRTLLAYLDNTLDKEAAEVLRLKLSESGLRLSWYSGFGGL